MVILFFDDGHKERAADAVLATHYAQTRPVQDVYILTPEEVDMLETEGVHLDLGYNDPRKRASWVELLRDHLNGKGR